jgi:16S rRNA (uracil1498-N3)-methyltransferase
VHLAGDDARKLTVVLRMTAGDPLVVVDSAGAVFDATLDVSGQYVRAALHALRETPARASLEITLGQGIPKGQKFDFVVEKATELGVARIVPFASERTVGEGSREGKLERWRRLAKTAAQQCGRADVPTIEAPTTFAALLARTGDYDATLVPWELEAGPPLRERLPALLAGAARVLVAIGPEGGLSHAEAAAAEAAGAALVSLGRRIFRTETAGLVACAAMLYERGDL